jgi:hypothetical protein
MVTPKLSSAPNQAPVLVILSSRGRITSVSVESLPCELARQLLQGGAALLAGLARGNADFHDLLVGKQAQLSRRRPAPRSSRKCAPATVCTVRSV